MAPGLNEPTLAPQDGTVRKYFRNVMEGHQLPSVPVVANKLLEMVQDPNVNMQKLCRVLGDDPALATRVLAVSRSPRYALRNPPNSLLGAVQVLGFRTLTSVVVTTATHSLCVKGNKISEKLWSHALGVALAMRYLCPKAGVHDADAGFLVGLMHDVGQMVFVNGDPAGYEHFIRASSQDPGSIVDKEQLAYGVDHAIMGHTLLNHWNLDMLVIQATLNHHSDVSGDENNIWADLLAVSDFLCAKCNLGFFTEPPVPPERSLARCALTDEAAINAVVEQIAESYRDESSLFKVN